jgi:hypothetical protein
MRHFLSIIFCASIISAQAQTSVNGYFDAVYDNFGNQYLLSNLQVGSGKPISNHASTVTSIPTNTCSAGYFNLYFEPGSYLDNTPAAKNVVCQVFTDLSAFIISPLANGPVKVNIICTDELGSPGATGTPFYVLPAFPSNPNQGILHNQIFKTIQSGVDAYTGVPLNTLYSTNFTGFYHGKITVKNSSSWNLNPATNTLSSGEYDLYGTVLHEAIHSLGFISLMDSNGASQLTSSNNYYSTYDQFLTDASGTPLLGSSTPACSITNQSYQALPVAIQSGTCPGTPGVTTCSTAAKYISANVNQAVYTPGCFTAGSSLSHFEDICYSNFSTTCTANYGLNDLYFLMSDGVPSGTCYLKRYLQEEERFVLCDIGYSVNPTYSLNGTAIKSYTSGACSGSDIWGYNDGYSNGAFTYTTGSNSYSIAISSIISNDAPATQSISCLEVIYNNGTAAISGSSVVVTSITNIGVVVVKYYPVNSAGKFGNATYIFVHFLPGVCNVNPNCSMIQNGGFENLSGGAQCGEFIGSGSAISYPSFSILDCWDSYYGTPDLFTHGCNSGINFPGKFKLGINTYDTNPAVDSYLGSANDRITGCFTFTNVSTVATEVLKNNLLTPLVPNTAYKLNLLVKNYSGPFLNSTVNTNSSPVVLTIGALPSFTTQGLPFPGGITPICEFTVAANTGTAWTAVTQTFVFTPLQNANHYAIVIGPDPIKSASFGPTHYVFIDEIALHPIESVTFAIPNSTLCGNSSFTNLALYATTTGTFSGPGVTVSNNIYQFNTPPTLPSGLYPVMFTYTNSLGCQITLSENVLVSSVFLTPASGPSTVCITNNVISLNGGLPSTSTGVNFIWQPGGVSGLNITVSPTTSIIYTLTAVNQYSCADSQTLAINLFTNCCGSVTIPSLAVSSIPTTTSITGPLYISSSFTIDPGVTLFLYSSEFLFASTASITVSNNATLIVQDSHLHTCTNSMWPGIVVLDGGKFQTPSSLGYNLIEDAKTAINCVGHFTSTLISILDINKTIFNKNFIAVNITDYHRSNTSYSNAFYFSDCVFTSRSLTYSGNSWPQGGSSSGELRYAPTGTTGLAPPYNLLGVSESSLKAPYSTQTSYIGIRLANVGEATPSAYFGPVLGEPSAASHFNLFDKQCYGILATESNLTSMNNVFQNTKHKSDFTSPTLPYGTGGAGISHNTPSTLNTLLDLTASSFDIGNRFWNCHYGVLANKTYRFNMEKALFRSTQSNTNTAFGHGNTGVVLNTNRMHYYMRYNEFTNVNAAINVPLSAGVYTTAATGTVVQNGIYLTNLIVKQNTFSPGSGSNTYLNRGVNLSCPNSVTPAIGPGAGPGISIETNEFNSVYRGIAVNGLVGMPTAIHDNTISLTQDVAYSQSQQGISINNCIGTTTNGAQTAIYTNTLSSVGSTSLSNSLANLIYVSQSSGPMSPSITCNTLKNSYRGFVFSQSNPGVAWRGNSMETIQHAYALINNGVIGQQGAPGSAIDNEWLGSWTSYTQTFIELGSQAISSKLFVRAIANMTPTSNFGTAGFPNWYNASSIFTTSGGYYCSMPSTDFNVPVPEIGNYETEESYYIANTTLYRFLYFNDSIRNSSVALHSFYANWDSSSIAKFLEIEDYLSRNNTSAAQSLVNSISASNQVEENYLQFYQVYIDFIESDELDDGNKSTLIALASLCPSTDGGCVYQSRALYNRIYDEVLETEECPLNAGAKKRKFLPQLVNNEKFDVLVYPIPSSIGKHLFYKNTTGKKVKVLKVTDITGREINVELLIQDQSAGKMKFHSEMGFYIISFQNDKDEIINKSIFLTD